MKFVKHNQQRGFTLIEIMVALVVLAVGMLGVAALYIESLRSGQMSVSYTNAVTLTADMADRIRANPLGLGAYVGAAANNAVAGSAAFNCVNGPIDCTPAQLAADDWNSWYEDVKNLMPQNRQVGIALVPAGPGIPVNTYTIAMLWPERGQPLPIIYTMTFSF